MGVLTRKTSRKAAILQAGCGGGAWSVQQAVSMMVPGLCSKLSV